MKKTILILLLFLLILPISVQSQQQEPQLAYKYYRSKEYEKASPLFLKLYKRTKYKAYFNYYISCIENLKQYEKAEKLLKSEIKKQPDEKSFLVELGYLYSLVNESDKVKKTYDRAIKKLIPVDSDIKSLANYFVAKRAHEYAIRTYKRGRELRKISNIYHIEMANVYLYQRNFEFMLDEFFNALWIDPSQLSLVQSRLQSALYQDIDSGLDELLRKKLLQHVQQQSNSAVFNELLLWYYTQKKEFASAGRLAKALTLRLNEDGTRLLDLAQLATANEQYEHALDFYSFIIKNKLSKENILFAGVGELSVHFMKLKNTELPDNEKLIQLENSYYKLLEQSGLNYITLTAVMQLAHLQAFYLDKTEQAFLLLDKIQNSKWVNILNRAQIKMLKSDILLFRGEVWGAILLYAQIEKSNKNSPIGYEAKLKKAKVAYYMGDFKWAQAQLDVLKASTSKLISNDAIALSQLISENTSLDSTEQAMKIFARADFLNYRQKNELAFKTLDTLINVYPGHSLTDEVYFKKYEIYFSEHNYTKALEALNKIIDDHGYDLLADRTLFKRAELYEKLENFGEAVESYKELISKHPDSIFVAESRERFNKLKDIK